MLSSWACTRVVKQATVENKLRFLPEEIVFRYGLPLVVISDHGSHFQRDFDKGLRQIGMPHILTTIYHPKSLGKNEKINGILKESIESAIKS